MVSEKEGDQERARELARKNIRLAILLGLVALAIFIGYIIVYF